MNEDDGRVHCFYISSVGFIGARTGLFNILLPMFSYREFSYATLRFSFIMSGFFPTHFGFLDIMIFISFVKVFFIHWIWGSHPLSFSPAE